ncbi:MAG: PQQ-binding-like beta-propeller repeat protein [Halobaculum sp.]
MCENNDTDDRQEQGESGGEGADQPERDGPASSRRKYLAALGTALGLAGCGGRSGSRTETVAPDLQGTPTDTPTATGTPTASPRPTERPVVIDPAAIGTDVPGYPTFGHDVGRTSYVREDSGPTATDDNWQHATDGQTFSSPAIADGAVFASSQRGGVYAVETQTGRRRWRVDTGGGFSSPAVADGTVFVGGRDQVVRALDAASGEEQWRFETGGAVHSGPAVADGTVYVGSFDGKLYALDAVDGTERWAYTTDDILPGSPAVDDSGVYILSFGGVAHAVERESGERRWQLRTGGDQALGSVAVADGFVFFGSNNDRVYALDAESGETRWWTSTRTGVGTSPAVTPEAIYVAALDEFLYALDIPTGEIQWQEKLGTGLSSPTVVGQTLYVGARDGTVYAIDRTDGTVQWEYLTGGDVRSSPAVADGVLAVGSADESIHAIGEGITRAAETAVDVVLDSAPNGLKTFSVTVETGGARIAEIVPKVVTGTGFEIESGGQGETSVTASGIVLDGTLEGDGSVVLFTVRLVSERTRSDLSVTVEELTDSDGNSIPPEQVSLRVRNGEQV